MPGFVLHLGATVQCSHGAPAQPTAPNPRVMVGGQPVVTLACSYVISGCPMAGVPAPSCVSGQWVTGALRVTAGGQPLAIVGGSSTCVATGTPMMPVSFQTRVTAS